MTRLRAALTGMFLPLAILFAVSAPQPVAAQEGTTITQIVVEGNQRIEPDTVRSYMYIAPGDPYDPEVVDRSLKTLFAT
ncbi:MAG: POTRA domain-containing protein, partial [Alphaproteobacteria bacterium]|nr:POTRA domain-containing protein [Alphaproteobacteria bacterium]